MGLRGVCNSCFKLQGGVSEELLRDNTALHETEEMCSVLNTFQKILLNRREILPLLTSLPPKNGKTRWITFHLARLRCLEINVGRNSTPSAANGADKSRPLINSNAIRGRSIRYVGGEWTTALLRTLIRWSAWSYAIFHRHRLGQESSSRGPHRIATQNISRIKCFIM